MTQQKLTEWVKAQLQQSNNIPVVTAGQGGSGFAYWEVEQMDEIMEQLNTCLSVDLVKQPETLEQVLDATAGEMPLSEYDWVAVVNLGEGSVVYVVGWDEDYNEEAMIVNCNNIKRVGKLCEPLADVARLKLGRSLAVERTAQGISIRKMAELAHSSPRAVQAVEKGWYNVGFSTYFVMAEILGMHITIV